MKKASAHFTLVLCVISLVPSPLFPQSSVDKVTAMMDSVSALSFDVWKVSPDLKTFRTPATDAVRPGFDDSRWETLRLHQSIYPDTCWLRKEIVLPPTMLGQPTRGAVRFLVSVDDYGYLWVNGESKGYFPWDGEFELTRDAQPGQKFLLVIKAVNTGGSLRLLRARVQSDASAATQQMIDDLSLSLRVGQKLLSFDTYQTNANARQDPGIDKSTIERSEKTRLDTLLQTLAVGIDVDALRNGSVEKFKSSVESVRPRLKPVQDFARRFTLYFDANAHIDAAWLWRSKETIEVCKNTFSSVINMMNQRPDFTYTQSSAAYYDWMQRLSPDLFRKIQQRVKEGRWEVVGGMWVEPDCNLPSGESWARHLLYGKRFFRQQLGTDVKIGWNPDSFGYNANMPLFYNQAGMQSFITQKIGWNETNVFPYRLFWWESADGSRILSYFPFDYVSTVDNPYRLVDWLRQFEANTGFTKLLILFGVGDHGGGPSLEMLNRIDRLKKLDIFPSIEHGTADHYLTWLRTQNLSSLPVWKDELYLEYHQGTFTTQSRMKQFNRSEETLLTNAEKFSSIAGLLGRPYHSADLEEAWKKVLFNQFHDILPGSGIREVYLDAADEHREAQAIGSFEVNGSLHHIAGMINTGSVTKGTPVVVFNPLAWERTDVTRVTLPEGDSAGYAVFNAEGKEIPSQTLTRGKYRREVIFIADRIPSLGYAVYDLRKQSPSRAPSTLKVSEYALENGLYEIAIDRTSGWLEGIRDKRTGKQILRGKGNELQLLEDLPKEYDAWNIGWTGVRFPMTFRRVEIVDQGPVRSTLRVFHDCLKPGRKKEFPTEDFPTSFFVQEISLYNSLDRIDFTTDVDWWEDRTMLKVAFPLSITDTVATYEIPYGTIQRSTQQRSSWEKAKVEVPALRWADLSDSDYGVSLLNTSKYGYDIKGNVMRLSLLRSPKWPDPTADRGKHSIDYSLYPHAGRWNNAQTLRRGYEVNNPLLAFVTNRHKGNLPPAHSFVTLTPPPLVLTTVKKAEDSDAWIVQWYNPGDRERTAALGLPKGPRKALLSNFLEEDGAEIPVGKNTLMVTTGSHAVVTVKVSY